MKYPHNHKANRRAPYSDLTGNEEEEKKAAVAKKAEEAKKAEDAKKAKLAKLQKYLACVKSTALEDAGWGAVIGAVSGFGVAVGVGGVAGSEGGPIGVILGAGGGAILGVFFSPENAGMGAVSGLTGGVIHGAIGCAI